MFALTKRLTLRPAWPEESATLAEAIGHEAVVTKLSRVPWPYGEADAAHWIALPRDDRDVSLAIVTRDGGTPRMIGGIGLHPDASGDGHEIGYWLTPDAWGCGYATEAGRALVDIARHALGLRQLNAGHFIDNPASGNVLKKLGFRTTGSRHVFSRARGADVECLTMTLDLDDSRPEPSLPIAA